VSAPTHHCVQLLGINTVSKNVHCLQLLGLLQYQQQRSSVYSIYECDNVINNSKLFTGLINVTLSAPIIHYVQLLGM